MKYKYWLFAMIVFVLVGCGSLEKLSTPNLTEILQISKIRSIEFKDDWTGLSDVAPLEAHYSLTAGATEYTGQVNFKVGEYSGEPMIDTENLQIPIQDMKLFINILAQSSLVEGEYKPLEEWTDDYPNLEIKIMLQTGNIVFYTSSQGVRYTPWAMRYNDKVYIIDAATPMDALDKLEKYFQKNSLEVLINRFRRKQDTKPTATTQPTQTPPYPLH